MGQEGGGVVAEGLEDEADIYQNKLLSEGVVVGISSFGVEYSLRRIQLCVFGGREKFS